jgi:hypothetical protein
MVSPYAALTLLSLWYWFIPETNAYHPTCLAIEGAVPTAYVSYPGKYAHLTHFHLQHPSYNFSGNQSYADDTYHWLPSSSEGSACSVEPGSVEDVSKIVN